MDNKINESKSTEKENFSKLEKFFPIINKRFVVIDTETTGLEESDHVYQICAIEVINGEIINETIKFFDLIDRTNTNNENTNYSDLAFSCNNLKYKGFNETGLITLLYEFIGKDLVVCHNAKFDYKRVNDEFLYRKLNALPKSQFACTMECFKRLIGDKNPNLEYCCKHFKIPFNNKRKHIANEDAYRCAVILQKLYQFHTINIFENYLPIFKEYLDSKNNQTSQSNLLGNKRENSDVIMIDEDNI